MARRNMPLIRSFKATVKARAERDAAFRDALLTEGVDALLAGDMDTGKAILRDYINATIGFDRLAEETGTPDKSLMRMLGPRGNHWSKLEEPALPQNAMFVTMMMKAFGGDPHDRRSSSWSSTCFGRATICERLR